MKSLLPYFEDELTSLRDEAGAFGERFPLVASALRLSDHGSDDPHVDRLIQSAAWFSARVAQRLDDGHAGFAETLLDAIYPHYRRPFPSCAVARFSRLGEADSGCMARGTSLLAGLAETRNVRFTVAFDADRRDPDMSQVVFHRTGRFTDRDGTFYAGAHLELRWPGRQGSGFRVFAYGEPMVAAALRDALGLGVKAVLRPDPDNDRFVVADGTVTPFGFEEDSAVLEDPVGGNPCFSLLREWLAHPETYGFFDLHWPDPDVAGHDGEIDDHGEPGEGRVFLLLDPAIVGDGEDLRSVDASNLVTRCCLVANLFRASTGVSSRAHVASTFDIVPHEAGLAADGLVAVESVVAKRPGDREPSMVIPHFHAVGRHAQSRSGPFWVFAGSNTETGCESLMFVDGGHQPTSPGIGATLSLRLLCCDGDLPRQIVSGSPAARLYTSEREGSNVGRLISRPTPLSRFPLGRQASWRLVSHLSLNQLALLKADGSALRTLLELYLAPGSAIGAQVVRAIVRVRHAPVTRWLGGMGGLLGRGTGIDLHIDRTQLIGVGLHAMVHVFDRLFAEYTHVNSFTELTITCHHTGQEIYRCRMRTGSGPLV